MQILNGKKLATPIMLEIKKQAAKLNPKPGLATVLVGNNPASRLYLKLKQKACQEVGIAFHSYLLDENCSEQKILEVIEFLNNDLQITGILVQLPLPKCYNTNKIIQAIDPSKDVDGFHTKTKVISPNVQGIIELLRSTETDLSGKTITILSNSPKFAEPFKKLLPNSKITYLTALSPKLKAQSLASDVLISALGKPYLIKPLMIKKDSILIDVGISKLKDKTVGDIDPACDKIAAYRSPVPGGVGPMTIAFLLKNILELNKY